MKEPEKINIYKNLMQGRCGLAMCEDTMALMKTTQENSEKRTKSKIEDVCDISQAIILTTMGMKADQFEVEMDNEGQNTVVGD